MDDLLINALADAKAVRETALVNAKLALEEAFTPKNQSMLSKKIQSETEGEAEEGESKDYFVHSTGLAEEIKDGDVVEFELAEDPKGMRAVNVKLVQE